MYWDGFRSKLVPSLPDNFPVVNGSDVDQGLANRFQYA